MQSTHTHLGAPVIDSDYDRSISEMGVLYSLSELTVDELAMAAQANHDNGSAEMAEILNRFEPSVRRIGATVAYDPNLRDDAEQGARWGLVQAVRTYKPSRAHFAGYAPLLMKREASRRVKELAPKRPSIDLDAPERSLRSAARRHGYVAPEPKPFTIEGIASALTPAQTDLVVAHYLADMTVTDLATAMGISKSAVSQRLNTIHKALTPTVSKAVAA